VGRGAPTAAALALSLASVLTGCGGGGGGGGDPLIQGNAPQPRETIEQFAERFKEASGAAVAGDCAVVKDFNRKAAITIYCGRKARGRYDDFKVTGTQSFGTAGIVDYTDAEAPGGATAVAAVDENGDFRLVSSLILSRPAPGGPRLEAQQVGTKATDQEARDQLVSGFIAAIRQQNCDVYFRLGLTPTRDKRSECRIEFDPKTRVQPQLAGDPAAEPEPLGGTQAFGFYGLSTDPGGHYRTIVLVPGPASGNPKYLALTYRSK
jgi:hypothetical protein